MLQQIFDLIEESMQIKAHIIFDYQGFERQVCAHTLGFKSGERKFLGFQFGGGSSKGLNPDGEWRCFFIDQISHISIQPGIWHTSGPHSKPQTCVDDVRLEVFG